MRAPPNAKIVWRRLKLARLSAVLGVLGVLFCFRLLNSGASHWLRYFFGGVVLLAVGHFGVAMFRCPRCRGNFSSTGRTGEDLFFMLPRSYLGTKCANCGARIGEIASTTREHK